MRISSHATILLIGGVLLHACSTKLTQSEDSAALSIHTYSKSFINIHYVKTDGKTLLIDCGNVGDSAKIEKYFAEEGLALSEVDYLILTHAHTDHAGNARYFQERYCMEIIAGAGELKMIQENGHDPDLCPRGFNGWLISNTLGGRYYRPFEPDILVEDQFDLSQIGVDGKIVVTPGHTPGSLTTFIKDKAFVGDLITARPLNQDKPEYHTFMCDLEDNLKDIEMVASEEGIEEWYLGHMGPLAIEDVKKFIEKENQ